MRRILGTLSILSLILSIGMVIYLLTSPLFALILTPYLVLSSAATLGFSVAYFYSLNGVSSRLLDVIVYGVAFAPLLIPVLACIEPDFMETYWRNYISLTLVQLGVGVLSASFFFKKPGVNFSNICAAVSSIVLFILGILVILETSILSSIPFLVTIATLISVLFFIALIRRLKEVH